MGIHKMTPEEHKKRHEELHSALDELIADYIDNGSLPDDPRLPTKTTLYEFMVWSHKQIENLDDPEKTRIHTGEWKKEFEQMMESLSESKVMRRAGGKNSHGPV